jgi:hypothetical protein
MVYFLNECFLREAQINFFCLIVQNISSNFYCFEITYTFYFLFLSKANYCTKFKNSNLKLKFHILFEKTSKFRGFFHVGLQYILNDWRVHVLIKQLAFDHQSLTNFISFFSITAITQRVMVGEGDPAHFECAVSANPLTAETIRWERKNYDMLSRTVTAPGAPKEQTHYFEHADHVSTDDGKTSAELGSGQVQQQQHKGVVLLTVLNATAEDSGLFWCVADNGIGGREVRNATYLLVRRKLLYSLLPRQFLKRNLFCC